MTPSMPPHRTLVWYRSDLRTADHQPLRAASRATDEVLAVYIATPGQWTQHNWGRMKADFVLRGVAALAERLEQMNIPLLYRCVDTFDQIPALLVKLAREHRCHTLYCEQEYEVNERRRDAAVAKACHDHGLKIATFETQTVVPPRIIRTTTDKPYSVFSPFRRRWLTLVEDADGLNPLRRPNTRPKLWLKPDRVNLADAEILPGHTRPDLWPATEDEAAKRLDSFIAECANAYHTARDFPARDATSTLSPYLAAGLISARTCLTAAYEANRGQLDDGSPGLVSWISELIWREFYKHVLISFPNVCRNGAFRPEMDIKWRADEGHFAAWCAGKTGYPLVDAGMRQLAETGWMHNRLRMVTAMFLSKHLLIDWRRGEQHFAQRLVDFDFASNNGGWQWSASTGTDAAPYFRIFNPLSQSKKFDPEGAFIRQYVPELSMLSDKNIHAPHEKGSVLGYPEPIVEHAAARQRALDAFKVREP